MDRGSSEAWLQWEALFGGSPRPELRPAGRRRLRSRTKASCVGILDSCRNLLWVFNQSLYWSNGKEGIKTGHRAESFFKVGIGCDVWLLRRHKGGRLESMLELDSAARR